MSHFEFLMVLAGIVVAVAMTETVGGLGRLIRARGRVTFDWLHLGWSYVVLLFSMLYWHGMWPYQAIEFTYVGQIWLLVIPTLFLVIVAFALSPEIQGDADLIVREYFLEKRRPIFAGLATFIAMAWVADFAITRNLFVADIATTLGLIAVFLLLAHSSKIWVHTMLLVLVASFLSAAGFQEVSVSLARFDV
jgi:hypothetical protein